ncbi:hypothetical protein NEFER03_1862 [Nematocida sp. LUAm3]|nr:hypothetical protein NEFER03_1862 [Nematocida sp. LUAm3]KAI5173988.1 hypothetical protein NEFER02_0455 [Nematocida sp. LUAm2]KAI5177267.1 hypothetical protein NEFER01_0542 [Nematocida sp. LUAm1]
MSSAAELLKESASNIDNIKKNLADSRIAVSNEIVEIFLYSAIIVFSVVCIILILFLLYGMVYRLGKEILRIRRRYNEIDRPLSDNRDTIAYQTLHTKSKMEKKESDRQM